MKETLAMLAAVAVALGMIATAIGSGGDRSLFVPGPETVVEDFTRLIVTRRFDLAPKYLAKDRKHAESPGTLANRFAPLFPAVGKVNTVDGQPRWMEGDRASATATVGGDRGSVSFDFSLVREKDGLWRIDTLPDLD